MSASTFDAAFREAFRLAWLLHRERATARAIATEAFAQLKVAAAAQRKRFYYRPRGARSKVEMSELQLLQRLVLIASEPHERASEAAGRAGQADLALRFVKHLVRITMKRNSFHVALGVTRVLHDYPTAAAMDVYGLLLDDPAKNPDDPYYRSRKRVLLGELAERFGPFVELVRGPGGEDRFAGQPSGPFAGLVRRALTAFAPWGGGEAAEADLRRTFTVLHPPGFDRLLASLRLPPAAERLALPAFRLEQETAPPNDPPEPPDPTAEELAAVQAELMQRAEARRRSAPAWLAVRVDGIVQGRVHLDGELCSLQLPEGAERIEITSADPEPELLALHLLGGPRPERFVIDLATGRLELAIDPAELRVSYARREPSWRWVIPRPAWSWTWAGAAAALLLAALPLLLWQRPPAPPVEPAAPVPITRGPLESPARPGRSQGVTLWIEPAPATVDPALAAALRRGLARRPGIALGEREAADLALRWLPGPGGATAFALVTREGSVLWRRPVAAAGSPDRRAAVWIGELEAYLQSSSRMKPDR